MAAIEVYENESIEPAEWNKEVVKGWRSAELFRSFLRNGIRTNLNLMRNAKAEDLPSYQAKIKALEIVLEAVTEEWEEEGRSD